MLDITERGHDSLKSLAKLPYQRLSRREKADLAILSYVWDERELAGGPIDDINVRTVVDSLVRRNPLWSRVATHELVGETISKIVAWTKLLERD